MVVFENLESVDCLVYEMASPLVALFLASSVGISIVCFYFGSSRSSASSPSPHLGYSMFSHIVYIDRVSYYGFTSTLLYHSN